ncbi:MAG: ABC transporter permease [Thermoflexales bacterium]|nr:ABC transporter permease [Thermoflexales bacterium]
MTNTRTLSEAPVVAEKEAQVYIAPQWKLVWWKFRKHKLALISAVIVILIYLVALLVEVLAPFPSDRTDSKFLYAPPQTLHLFDEQGQFAPYVNGYTSKVEPVALRRVFIVDPSTKIPLGFFVKGYSYKLLGLIPMDRHLIGPLDKDQPVYLLGADRLGRDLLSRLIAGTRVSMSIGLIGVLLSLVLGILLGGLSGYYGGWVDNLIQRTIDFLRSIPSIPLWMGLAAALPLNWPPDRVYFAITVILSLIGWTSLARVVRGRFLSLREEDFIMAARLDGQSELGIILFQMLPAFTSHIIAAITLAIPGMILSETALSFLGLGLRDPVVSWGVLLQESQDIRAIATAPWLLIPALAVVLSVLTLNFLGDGLRDAADPYAR